jgi:hypothetical protein
VAPEAHGAAAHELVELRGILPVPGLVEGLRVGYIYPVKIFGAFFPAGRHANTPFRRFSVFSYPVYYNPKLLQSKPKYAIIVKK